jgi:hypothetical protein
MPEATIGPEGDAPPFDHERFPRRLNLGCGFDRRDGYLNVDLHAFHEPDLVADVRDLSMLPAAAYDEILAQDVLEHLGRTDVVPTLREWARLLRPGGVLILRVPDLVGLLGLLVTRRARPEQEELVQCLYGTQAYDGDFHHNAFTEVLLRHYLHDAGFEPPEIRPMDEWMFDVRATRASGPPVLDLGALPFMTPPFMAPPPAAPPAPAVAGGSEAVEGRPDAALEHIRTAEAHADLGLPLGPTRWRILKRAAVRVHRTLLHHQIAHNHAVDAALRDLHDRHDRHDRRGSEPG